MPVYHLVPFSYSETIGAWKGYVKIKRTQNDSIGMRSKNTVLNVTLFFVHVEFIV